MTDPIQELIRKESERYGLFDLGLMVSKEKIPEGLQSLFPEMPPGTTDDFKVYKAWRKEVLILFYNHIGYSDFLKKNGASEPVRRFVFVVKKRLLYNLWKKHSRTTLDRELSLPNHTFAYKLSYRLAYEDYSKILPHIQNALMGSDLEQICLNYCAEKFPLEFKELEQRLKLDDSEYWNDIYILIKKISRTVTSKQYISKQYKQDSEHDTWADSALLIYDKIREGDHPEFKGPAHFRNYMAKICINKCFESVKKIRMDYLSTDDPDFSKEEILKYEATNEESGEEGLDVYLLRETDLKNEVEMGNLLSYILWNKTEPWYEHLTRNQEDKIRVLLGVYVEDLSYEEIAERDRPDLSSEQKKKYQNKLRKDVERVKKRLKERFYELVIKQKNF